MRLRLIFSNQFFFLAHYEEGFEAIMTNEKKPLDNCY